MARRCICSAWHDRVRGNLGFLALPLAVQAIWFRLLVSLTAKGAGGRARFLCSVTQGVSRSVSLPEPEVRTALEALATLGFLEWDDVAGTIALPGAEEGDAVAAVARINGRKGGRPRKGETPEMAYARREREDQEERAQTTLPLPINGGKATGETQAEPADESSRAGAAKLKPSSDEEALAARREGWRETASLRDELLELAHIEGPPHSANYHIVRQYLAEGATPELLRQVIGRCAARPGYTVPRSGLGYFKKAVREAMSNGGEVPGGGIAMTQEAREEGLSERGKALQAWYEGGMLGRIPVAGAA